MLAKIKKRNKKRTSFKSNRGGGFSGLRRKAATRPEFITRQVLGIKQYRSLITKILSLSWRFIAAFLFVFYIDAAGPNPYNPLPR